MGGIGDGVCVMVGLGWIGSFGRLLLALDFRFRFSRRTFMRDCELVLVGGSWLRVKRDGCYL